MIFIFKTKRSAKYSRKGKKHMLENKPGEKLKIDTTSLSNVASISDLHALSEGSSVTPQGCGVLFSFCFPSPGFRLRLHHRARILSPLIKRGFSSEVSAGRPAGDIRSRQKRVILRLRRSDIRAEARAISTASAVGGIL